MRSLTCALLAVVSVCVVSWPQEAYIFAPPWYFGSGEATSVAFSPDGRTAAACYDRGVIWLWDTGDGSMRPFMTQEIAWYATGQHYRDYRSVAFSQDGKTLASVSWSRYDGQQVTLWEVATGRPRLTLSKRDSLTGAALPPMTELEKRNTHARLSSVVFSPDGRLMAVGSDGGTINLWDPSTGQHIRSLEHEIRGFYYGVASLAFSPDGRTLAAGTSNSPIVLWDTSRGGSSGCSTGTRWVTTWPRSPSLPMVRLWLRDRPTERSVCGTSPQEERSMSLPCPDSRSHHWHSHQTGEPFSPDHRTGCSDRGARPQADASGLCSQMSIQRFPRCRFSPTGSCS